MIENSEISDKYRFIRISFYRTPASMLLSMGKKLNVEVNRVLLLPEVEARYTTLGLDPVTMQPTEFATFTRDESPRTSAL
jgi:hypothetical protein